MQSFGIYADEYVFGIAGATTTVFSVPLTIKVTL
jgi:hypothetical protein